MEPARCSVPIQLERRDGLPHPLLLPAARTDVTALLPAPLTTGGQVAWRTSIPSRPPAVKTLFKPLLLLPILALSAGCATHDEDSPSTHPLGRHSTKMDGEPNMYDVAEKDREMEHATRRARQTVGQFIAAVQQPTNGQHDFQVKKLFVKDGKGEHIWLANVKFVGNRFVGVVDNKPVIIPGLKLGAKASVNPDEISDWSYVENGRLVGGYTVRVLYSELTPQERMDFEKQAGFHVGPQPAAQH